MERDYGSRNSRRWCGEDEQNYYINFISLVDGMTLLLVARSTTDLATSLTASRISSNSAIAMNSVVAASCMPSFTNISKDYYSRALTDDAELVDELKPIRHDFADILVQL